MKRTFVFIDGDIKPYKSMIDGRMITSRSQHKRHLKANNCIEVGNETMQNTAPPPVDSKRRDILRAQLANMTHSQANKILSKLRDDLRFSNYPHRKG